MNKQRIIIFAILILVATAFLPGQANAQAPNKMSYQAVIRNTSNALVSNQAVGMQISILQGSPTGTSVYVETQTPTTNANALVSMEIGSGIVVSGDFTTIDWANGPYYIKTETDPAGGTSYSITGTSQLLTVPYALYSKTAENVINDNVDDADADPTNELQDWSTLPGIPSDFTDNIDNVDDADADSTNEIEIPIGGTSGQILSTDGSGNYSWTNQTANNLPNGSAVGQTAHWDGSAWVVDAFLYNDGTNIGVGTSTPTGTLDVAGSGPSESSLLLRNGNPIATNVSTQVGFGYSNSDQYKHYISTRHNGGSTYNNSIDFYTSDGTPNGTQSSSILNLSLNGGKVGIGGNFPTEALDVNGNVKFSGAIMPNNTAGTSGQVLTSAGAGLPPIWTTISNTNIYNSDGSLTGNRIVTQASNTLSFTSTATNGFSVDGTTFSVDAANNRIGIGTATPNGRLAVGASIGAPLVFNPVAVISDNNGEVLGLQGSSAGSNINFYKNGSTSRQAIIGSSTNGSGADIGFRTTTSAGVADQARMIIKADGNVGIATTTPQGALHVNGANGASSWTYFQGNTGAGGAGSPAASVTTGLMIGWNSTNIGGETELVFGRGAGTDPKLNFATWDGTTKTQLMTITDDGNVGIGTINPARKLHVMDVMRLEPLAVAPATPSKGDMYFNGTTNKLMVFDGAVWQACW